MREARSRCDAGRRLIPRRPFSAMRQSSLLRTSAFARPGLLAAVVTFAFTSAGYFRTLLPSTVGGDAGELQYAGPLFALVHPTGQPLYVLLGYFWSHVIPWGSPAWRMNALAAVSAAAACAVTAGVLGHLYGRLWVGLSSGLVLGWGGTFWSQAVIADKYAFGAFLAALTCGLALVWAMARERTDSDRLLYALCLAYGLCLLHHRSLFLFGPGLVLLVWLMERARLWRRPRRTLICLGLALVPPLAGYALLLPWMRSRGLSPLNWQPQTAVGWLDWWLERHILTGYALSFGPSAGSSLADRLALYGRTLWQDYTPVVLLLALLGAVALWRRRPALLVFFGLSFLFTAGFAANFRGNQQQFTIFYLPSFVVLIYLCGIGIGEAGRWIRVHRGGADMMSRALAIAPIALLLVVPAYQFGQNYGPRRLAAEVGAPLDIWRQVLKSGTLGERLAAGMDDLPRDAAVIGDWEQITVLWYYQKVEGRRPDLELIYPIERLADYIGGDRPACVTRSVTVGPEWHLNNVGPLVCLTREPMLALPGDAIPLGKLLYAADRRPALELAAYRWPDSRWRSGAYAPLTLIWRAAGERRPDLHVSLHILDEQWQQVWAEDSAPVLGMYPTSRWRPAEVVADYRELAIAPTLRPGRYLWTVVVYRLLADGRFEQMRDAQDNIEILGGVFEVHR